MRYAVLPDNYSLEIITKNETFSLAKCIFSTICVERVVDHFGLGLTKIDPLWRFFHFRSTWPWPLDLDLKFVPLITLFQRYVSTKLEVPKDFLYRENRRNRRTDGQTGGQCAMRPPRKGRIIICQHISDQKAEQAIKYNILTSAHRKQNVVDREPRSSWLTHAQCRLGCWRNTDRNHVDCAGRSTGSGLCLRWTGNTVHGPLNSLCAI